MDEAPTLKEEVILRCLSKFYSNAKGLESYKEDQISFISSGCEDGGDEHFQGLLNIETFREKISSADISRVLKEAKLSEEEISFVQNSQHNKATLPSDVRAKSLAHTQQSVVTKFRKRESALTTLRSSRETFNGAVELTRLEYEDEVRHGRISRMERVTDTWSSGLTTDPFVRIVTKRSPEVHPDHPLNKLADIEKELFPTTDARETPLDENYNARTRKKFKYGNNFSLNRKDRVKKSSNDNVEDRVSDCTKFDETVRVSKTLWDVQLPSSVLVPPQNNITDNIPIYNSTFVDSYHAITSSKIVPKKKDFSKSYVMLPDKSQLLSLSYIEGKRMAPHTLLEKFPRYNQGSSSRTLYIKNLCRGCTPLDLMKVFGNFDTGKERIIYRLLRGRMKGQAFVRLATVPAATAALNTCHGYELEDKPMVIEFGRDDQ